MEENTATVSEKLTRIKTAVDRVRVATNTSNNDIEDVAAAVEEMVPPTYADDSKDILFVDYDGTPIYSYDLNELASLESLPTPPSHEGLVFERWNWTLADLIANNAPMTVGPYYNTNDNCTKIRFTIDDERYLSLTLDYNQTVANGVEVDWGDGSPTATSSQSGDYNRCRINHTYPALGTYTISLKVNDGRLKFRCDVMTYSHANFPLFSGALYYNKRIEEINTGANVTLYGNSVFANVGAKAISINTSIQYDSIISLYANTTDLKFALWPEAITSITQDGVFVNDFELKYVSFPKTLSSISLSSSGYNETLSKPRLVRLDIPQSVSTFNVANTLFKLVVNAKYLTLPPVGDIPAIPGLEKIYIPEGTATSITGNKFKDFSALIELDFPSNIVRIEGQALYMLYSLIKVVFHGDISTLTNNNFRECPNTKEIFFLNNTVVPTLDNQYNFLNVSPELKIYVPDALYDDWKAANYWVNVANKIYKLSDYNE